MNTSTGGKIGFFFSHSLKGIVRNKRRYILFAVVLFAVSLIVVGMFLLSNAAIHYIDAPENSVYPDEFNIDRLTQDEETQNVREKIESIFYFSNVMILSFGFLGAVTLVFASLSLMNERMYEAGILFALGINKLYIFFSLLVETVVFVLFMLISGMVSARGILETLFVSGALPDLRSYMIFNSGFIIAAVVIGLIFIIIPSFILLAKIINASPLKLLSGRK